MRPSSTAAEARDLTARLPRGRRDRHGARLLPDRGRRADAARARPGPQPAVAHRAGPAVDGACCWRRCSRSAALFETDHEDGSLDVIATGPPAARSCGGWPRRSPTGSRPACRWCSLAPVLGLLLNLELAPIRPLVATMLVGTPAVSFLGAIGAALTLRARKGGLLVALLVLPLYVPDAHLRHLELSRRGAGRTSGLLALCCPRRDSAGDRIRFGRSMLGPIAAAPRCAFRFSNAV